MKDKEPVGLFVINQDASIDYFIYDNDEYQLMVEDIPSVNLKESLHKILNEACKKMYSEYK